MQKKSKKKVDSEEICEKEEVLEQEVVDYKKLYEKALLEIEALKDDFLRRNADLENFRKRLVKEKTDAITFANSSLINDLLPTLDALDRAELAESSDVKIIKEGLTLIKKQLGTTLANKWGLVRMESKGKEFNPEEQQAYLVENDPSLEHEVVLEDLECGYYLHDRVLRCAKVKVGKP